MIADSYRLDQPVAGLPFKPVQRHHECIVDAEELATLQWLHHPLVTRHWL
jgi:hypothetical protein